MTGASRGLGKAIAEALEAKGCEVFKPKRCDFDLMCLDDVMNIVKWAQSQIDVLDILISCAGRQGPVSTAAENGELAWLECMQINLNAPATLCRRVAKWMIDTRTAGSIINISGGGATSPRPNYSAYATAKCGLVRFSETLAMEVEQYGIRVNCVAPGLLNTGMGSPEGDPPERAAQLVAWLASDASSPITGRLISAKWDPWDKPGFLSVVRGAHKDLYTLRRVDHK